MKQAIISGKLLRLFGAMLLALAAVLCVSINASAEAASNITYLDENGKEQTCNSATVVTSSDTTWSDGWYVVNSDVTNDNRIEVSGTVNLILTDGYSLTASKGITVKSENTFTIYAQSGGTGELTAGPADSYYAGIGGAGYKADRYAGTITINGGTVTATGGNFGAGIGGSGGSADYSPAGSGGTITINGGTVTATGNNGGAGIGGGGEYGSDLFVTEGGDGGAITITGGTITATGSGAPIGGGGGTGSATGGGGGTITITGGYLNLTKGSGTNYIGGGDSNTSGTISITGGYYAVGDISGQTVYSIAPDSQYYVYNNPDSATKGTYPYVVAKAKPIVIESATVSNKVYDGTTTVDSNAITLTFDDGTNAVALTKGTDYTVSAEFADENVGTQSVTVTVTLRNTSYVLLNTTYATTARITAQGLTFTANVSGKVYDGTTDVAGSAISSVTFSGLVSGESLERGTDYTVSAVYDTAEVGTDKDVTVTVELKDSNRSKNYTLSGDTYTAQANITAQGLTFTADVDDKVYDGTADVAGSAISNVTFSGLVDGETLTRDTDYTVSAVYGDANVGDDKTVTVTVELKDGGTGKNYTLSGDTYTAQANITAQGLTFTADVDGKVYDGTTDVAGSAIAVTFDGVAESDSLTAGTDYTDYTVSAVYDSAEVGTQSVTVTVTLLNGNYALTTATYTTTSTIAEQGLTFTADVASKVYDGTTAVDSSAISNVTFSGLVGSETLTRDTDYTVSAVYGDANVGTEKNVTVTVELKDSNTGKNYTLSNSTYETTANIAERGLTFKADVSDKVYDGTTAVDSDAIAVTFDGVAEGETLVAGTDYTVSAVYDSAEVGTGKNVTVTVELKDSDTSKNYTLSNSTYETTASITAQGLTFTADVTSKVYDGTTAVDSSAISNVSFSGLVDGETLTRDTDYTVSAVYTNANAEEQNVIVTVVLKNGNYSLSSTTYETTATITKKAITISAASAENKTYDGTATATATIGAFDGLVNSETLTAGEDYTITATFDNANVGTGKTVTVTVALTDTEKSKNYTLSSGEYTTTASITKQGLTFTADVSSKVYDGTTAVDSSAITLTFSDGTSEVTLTEGTDYTVSAVYDSAEVGTQSVTVTVELLNSNYTLSNTTYQTTAAIAEQGLTFTADVSSKVYDGTTDVSDSAITLTFSDGTSEVTLTEGTDYTVSAVYASEETGTQSVTVTVELLNSNYTLSNTTYQTTAAIAEQGLTFTADVSSKVYDGTTDVADSAITLTFTDGTSEVALTEDTDYTVSAVYDSAEVGTQSVTVTVTMLNSNYALTSYTYTTTATITASDSTVTISADSSDLTGGETVTLTVSAPSDVDWSEFTVTCSDSSITVTNNGDGTFTAVLPDESKTYTFTVTYTGSSYTIADTVCTVTVTETAAEEEAVTVCDHVYVYDGYLDMYSNYRCIKCGDIYSEYYATDANWKLNFWGLVREYYKETEAVTTSYEIAE